MYVGECGIWTIVYLPQNAECDVLAVAGCTLSEVLKCRHGYKHVLVMYR